MSDQTLRDFAAGTPMPDLGGVVPWTPLTKPRSECRVAIVTTAALHLVGDEGFVPDDVSYRVLPADRLDELASDGTIGSVADHHYAFAGNQEDTLTGIRLDSGPAVARLLRDDDVDVVLLTPV